MTFNFSGIYNVADAEQAQNAVYVNAIMCHVWLLDNTSVSFKMDKHCRGQDLLDLTFDYLELLERDFFGLVYNLPQTRSGSVVKWVDPTKKIYKQLKTDSPFTFWFRVKFYVPNPIWLHEEYTRYQFFLQVRKDILEGRLPVSKNSAAHLAGLALQSELGDYNSEDCRPGYVAQFRFIPQQTAEFEAQASEWHRKSTSMLPSAAELEYLNVARHLERYGTKTQEVLEENEGLQTVLLGVSHVGITVFRTNRPNPQFPWENVLKIQFRGKKFIVHLKTSAVTLLPMHQGSVIALNRAMSNSTLNNLSPSIASTGAMVHTFRFSSSMLAKLFWQYAVACHAFFRVREPPTGDSRVLFGATGLRSSIGGTTSISATGLYAAIARATGGIRRYFSLARGSSAVTASLSGPVGGIGRTLSTVMELRRNSRVFDRGFSRTSSRRSNNRRSMLCSTLNVTFSNSGGVRSGSNTSLADPTATASHTIPAKTYAQVPPPGTRASFIGKHAGSRTGDTTTPATSRYSSMSAISSRLPKRPNPNAATAQAISHAQLAQPQQQETHPSGSRGASGTVDKLTRVRGSKPGSPTTGSIGRASQRRVQPSSPPRNHTDTTSPKSNRRTPEQRVAEKPRQSPTAGDEDRERDRLHESDQSDSDATINGDLDGTEAIRYWHNRRIQAVRGPARHQTHLRNRSNSGSSHHPVRQDTSTKRRPGPDSLANSELPPGTEMAFKAGFTRNSNATHRIQTTGSIKKSNPEPAIVESKETQPLNSVPPVSKTGTTSPSPGFVKDPFHPGAPAGEMTGMVPLNVDNSAFTNFVTPPDPAGGLVRIRMRPDSHGCFGFNVRGGSDQGTPIIVSRVGANMPADLCIPRLSEGDQLCSINGRDVSSCTHAQVVGFIRAASENRSAVLELLVRPSDYVLDEWNNDEPVVDSGDAPPLPPRVAHSSLRSVASSGGLMSTLNASVRRLANHQETSHSNAYHNTDNHNSVTASVRNSIAITDPLLQSMLDLETGLSDGSILAQFEQLPRKKPGYTTEASRLNENVLKNRYRDISPYDQTRVILRQGSGDYINANYVSMDFPKAGFTLRYIAAQGPLPSTYGDFWQMCWEQNVNVVVMLTAVSERGRVKCHQYWPNMGQTLKFSASRASPIPVKPNTQRSAMELQLQTVREEVNADFAFREFLITSVSNQFKRVTTSPEQNPRRVVQLQFISWPDHGVPGNTTDLITFVDRVRKARGSNLRVPIVVHCSAGIGRTGVLITMETALNLMERDHPVRPLELVQLMRSQRALLIQTTNQFQFVCEAILKVFQREHASRILK